MLPVKIHYGTESILLEVTIIIYVIKDMYKTIPFVGEMVLY